MFFEILRFALNDKEIALNDKKIAQDDKGENASGDQSQYSSR